MNFLSRFGRRPNYSSVVDIPLLSLSPDPTDNWIIGDSFENTLITGATGSGKTSGPARALAMAFMKAGYGGVVLCAKADEAPRWRKMAQACGRESAIIEVNAKGGHRCNILETALSLPAEKGGGSTDTATNMLMNGVRIAHRFSGGEGAPADFWMKAMKLRLSTAIASLYHAQRKFDMDELMAHIHTTPASPTLAGSPDSKSLACYKTMHKLFHNPVVPLSQREAEYLVHYHGQTIPQLDIKTRSNIDITVETELQPFMRGTLHDLFCTHTTFSPEAAHRGAIILLNLPIKLFDQAGIVAQAQFKYLFQKLTERRTIDENTRPVFLFADEAQFFIDEDDVSFMSTSRSSMAATVLVTQSLPALYAHMGGKHPQDHVDALLANCQTKIACSNTCSRTNQWYADIIGKEVQERQSGNWNRGSSSQRSSGYGENYGAQRGRNKGRSSGFSSSTSYSGPHSNGSHTSGVNFGRQEGSSHSASFGQNWNEGTSQGHSSSEGGGWSEHVDYALQPSYFANELLQGGSRNDHVVTSIWIQGSRCFTTSGRCWTKVKFKQF